MKKLLIEESTDKLIELSNSEIPEKTEQEIELVQLNGFNPKNIQKKLDKLLKQISHEDEVTINISSGTKIWTFAFINTFKDVEKVRFIFIDQNNRIYNLSENEDYVAKTRLDLHTRFELYGDKIIFEGTSSDELTKEDFNIIPSIENARRFNFATFNKLTIGKDTKEDAIDSDNFVKNSISGDEIHLKMSKKDGTTREFEFKAPHIKRILYDAAWFEIKVLKLFKRWAEDKREEVNSILWSCTFESQNHKDKNEFDIIVDWNVKPLFIECKTQIKNGTDLDKFTAAVKNYSGIGSKKIFITDSELKNDISEKCRDNGIIHLSIGRLNEDEALVKLTEILDKELKKQNTK